MLSKLYHTTDRGKNRCRHRHGKQWKAEGRQEKQHVVTVIVSITFDSELLSCLSERKRQINIVIHNFRLNSSCFYCLYVSFWGHSICRNSDKRISIDCWWDHRISKWSVFFPPSLCFFLQNGQGVKQWSKAHKKTAVINKHNKTLI